MHDCKPFYTHSSNNSIYRYVNTMPKYKILIPKYLFLYLRMLNSSETLISPTSLYLYLIISVTTFNTLSHIPHLPHIHNFAPFNS